MTFYSPSPSSFFFFLGLPLPPSSSTYKIELFRYFFFLVTLIFALKLCLLFPWRLIPPNSVQSWFFLFFFLWLRLRV